MLFVARLLLVALITRAGEILMSMCVFMILDCLYLLLAAAAAAAAGDDNRIRG